jgi:aminoglycoside phosphotransferase (APT) family kinase protein
VAVWDAEIEVDEALARALIAARFPALDASSLRRVGVGWDNVVWATVGGVAFRFPRRRVAIAGVEREIALLPALAPRLPLTIPDAAYPGAPCARFPWPWFGSRLIAGREIAAARLDDAARIALASQLAAFLRTLHDLELDLDGAAALPADPLHRTHMAIRVPATRTALAAVAPLWTTPVWVDALLAEAERLPAPAPSTLVHGDLHVRHVLVDAAGAAAGVIDWGDVCRADPSADLSLYWSLLTPAGRDAFLAAYGPVEEHALLRARVLALFLCATLATYARAEDMPELEREALDGLTRTLIG